MPRSMPKNVIVFKGYSYATLNSNAPAQQLTHDQIEFLDLPADWQIAPDMADIVQGVIAKHYWGLNVLHVEGGNGYKTLKYANGASAGQLCDKQIPLSNGSGLKPVGSERGLLIRSRCLKFEDGYPAKVLAKLWQNPQYSDCVLCCTDGEQINCHRAILAQASPVFDRMFGTEMREASEQTVNITNAENHIVKALVQFAYTGKLTAEGANIVKLLTLADFYQMETLVKACAHKAVECIDNNSVVNVVHTLRNHLENSDVEAAFTALRENLQAEPDLLSTVMKNL